jgi:hypothetical protein
MSADEALEQGGCWSRKPKSGSAYSINPLRWKVLLQPVLLLLLYIKSHAAGHHQHTWAKNRFSIIFFYSKKHNYLQ